MKRIAMIGLILAWNGLVSRSEGQTAQPGMVLIQRCHPSTADVTNLAAQVTIWGLQGPTAFNPADWTLTGPGGNIPIGPLLVPSVTTYPGAMGLSWAKVPPGNYTISYNGQAGQKTQAIVLSAAPPANVQTYVAMENGQSDAPGINRKIALLGSGGTLRLYGQILLAATPSGPGVIDLKPGITIDGGDSSATIISKVYNAVDYGNMMFHDSPGLPAACLENFTCRSADGHSFLLCWSDKFSLPGPDYKSLRVRNGGAIWACNEGNIVDDCVFERGTGMNAQNGPCITNTVFEPDPNNQALTVTGDSAVVFNVTFSERRSPLVPKVTNCLFDQITLKDVDRAANGCDAIETDGGAFTDCVMSNLRAENCVGQLFNGDPVNSYFYRWRVVGPTYLVFCFPPAAPTTGNCGFNIECYHTGQFASFADNSLGNVFSKVIVGCPEPSGDLEFSYDIDTKYFGTGVRAMNIWSDGSGGKNELNKSIIWKPNGLGVSNTPVDPSVSVIP